MNIRKGREPGNEATGPRNKTFLWSCDSSGNYMAVVNFNSHMCVIAMNSLPQEMESYACNAYILLLGYLIFKN